MNDERETFGPAMRSSSFRRSSDRVREVLAFIVPAYYLGRMLSRHESQAGAGRSRVSRNEWPLPTPEPAGARGRPLPRARHQGLVWRLCGAVFARASARAARPASHGVNDMPPAPLPVFVNLSSELTEMNLPVPDPSGMTCEPPRVCPPRTGTASSSHRIGHRHRHHPQRAAVRNRGGVSSHSARPWRRASAIAAGGRSAHDRKDRSSRDPSRSSRLRCGTSVAS